MKDEKQPVWQKSQYANLIRYVPSGTYYARIRIRGKLLRKSLNTDLISVANLRLNDLEKAERQAPGVMRVHECQKAMDRGAKVVGMKRITHHDLCHLFATRCIESGVDIPTVSRWLGHKEDGALAMKVYGHLRDQHSASMAQKAIIIRKGNSWYHQ